jgi:hypothetical protein
MTRKSRRELEREIEKLTDSTVDTTDPAAIVWEDEAGDWYANPSMDDDPVDPSPAGLLIIMSETVVETDWEPHNCSGGGR